MDMGAIKRVAIGTAAINRESGFLDHIQAEIFQHRHDARQGNRASDAIDFQTQIGLVVIGLAIDTHSDFAGAFQRFQLEDIGERLFRIVEFAIPGLEGVLIGPHPHPDGFRRIATNMGFQIVFPGAGETADLALELAGIRLRMIKRVEPDDVVNARQRAVAELRVKSRQPAAKRFAYQFTRLLADL